MVPKPVTFPETPLLLFNLHSLPESPRRATSWAQIPSRVYPASPTPALSSTVREGCREEAWGWVSPPRSLGECPASLRSPAARVSPPRLPHARGSCCSCPPELPGLPRARLAHAGLPPAGRKDHELCPLRKPHRLAQAPSPSPGGPSCWAPGTSATAGLYCPRVAPRRHPTWSPHLTEHPTSVSKHLEFEKHID